jgi:ABC-type branched-subunit amino acid transport system ATPase component
VPTAAGTVHLAGEAITGLSTEAIARRGIGLVPQGRRLFSGLTVDENLRLGALSRTRGAGTHWTRERIYDRFPRIRERLRTSVELLSGGEQQMVAIARALAGNVRVLLMDEPFEGLSPAMVEEVHAGIQSLRGEVAIVIIEHHLDLVLALSDRAVVLDRGSVSHVGPSAPLREDLELRRRVLWV